MSPRKTHVPHQSWDDRKRLINGDGAYSVRQSVSVARTLGLF